MAAAKFNECMALVEQLWQGKSEVLEVYPESIGLGSSPGVRSERPATSCVTHDTGLAQR
jgi:hypothetical protein